VVPVLALVIATMLLPAVAEAKVTCEGARQPERDVRLRGLPDDPVAGRVYRLTATLRPDEGVNHAPHLGAQHCGDRVPHEARAGAGGWFRRQNVHGDRVYGLDLRFSAPGPWALSFMDRAGRFHDLGWRWVETPGGRELAPQQPLGDGVVDQGAELLGALGLDFPGRDVPGPGALALEEVLWIFAAGAAL
jgi:hypothetical protein